MKKIFILLSVLVIGFLVFWYKKDKAPKVDYEKKTIVTVNRGHIKGLDPIQSADVYSAGEVAKVYEGLMEFHYLARPFKVVPNLAAEMPHVSDDQLTYTFKIRQGVTFQVDSCFGSNGGRELTAHDFAYSMKRLADPRLHALGFWLVDGKLEGINEWRAQQMALPKTDYELELAGVRALDKYTLQFKLAHPYPQFLYVLTMCPCFVVPHEAVDMYGPEFMNHPVGTGPFTLACFKSQDTKITYNKNLHFRDKYFPDEAAEEYKHLLVGAGKKLPFVDTVITYILPEEQPRWLKFNRGDIDFIDVSRDQIAHEVVRDNQLLPELAKKGVKLFNVTEPSTSYLVMNLSNDLFKNPKLRQAISLAFDGDGFNKLFYNNMACQAQSTIPPGTSGYQEDWVNPYRVHDVSKAKQYLAAAGYPGGKGLPEITLDVTNQTRVRQQAEFIKKCLEKIGLKVNILESIFPVLNDKIVKKETMLHIISWQGDYPDGENFLQLFYGPNQAGGIGTYHNDSTFNALYEQSSRSADERLRDEVYAKLNRMVGEQALAVCTVHPPHLSLHHGWLKNYCWSPFCYGIEIYLDKDVKEELTLIEKADRQFLTNKK